jgi:hypothetical protein
VEGWLNLDEKIAAVQVSLAPEITKLLNEHGIEAVLYGLAAQFGITGATAVICGAINPFDFAGKYMLRALSTCDALAKQHYIEGVSIS